MSWIKQLFSRRRLYNDLSDEIQQHLEEKIDGLAATGMPRKEATAAARREFGNVTLVEQDSRNAWRWPSIEDFFMDLRYAARMLRKSPGFTAVAVLTLALGIAVNATMFSMVSAFLLRRPPGREPSCIVVISGVNPVQSFQSDLNGVSAPNYLAWRYANHGFSDLAAADEYRTLSLTGQGLDTTGQPSSTGRPEA